MYLQECVSFLHILSLPGLVKIFIDFSPCVPNIKYKSVLLNYFNVSYCLHKQKILQTFTFLNNRCQYWISSHLQKYIKKVIASEKIFIHVMIDIFILLCCQIVMRISIIFFYGFKFNFHVKSLNEIEKNCQEFSFLILEFYI